MSDCIKQIQIIFSDILLREVDSPTTDLLDTGILDSMALVELLASLEQKFSLTLNIIDLDLENFRSIQSIGEFVSATQKQGAVNENHEYHWN